MGYRSTSRVSLLLLAFAAVLLVFPATAFAATVTPDGTTSASAPTIQSDLADYPPGASVTLTGSNWQPDESVHINVNDDQGQTWSRDADVTADASGNITDQFDLPNWFVANYSVKATGASGSVATTTFTDAMRADVTVNPSVVAGGSTRQFTLHVTNTNNAGTTNKLGCTQIQLPASPNNYSNVSIVSNSLTSSQPTSGTPKWTATYNSTTRTVQMNAGNSNISLANGQFVEVKINATAPNTDVSGDTWNASATEGTDCTGAAFAINPQPKVTVDSTPPVTSITSGPADGSTQTSNSASFSFSSNEAGSTFQCSLDGAAFSTCTSPQSYSTLSQGSHTFQVQATDAAGNTDPTPASRTWTVDSVAPTVSNVAPSDGQTNVAVGTNVDATFSEAMNASTISGSTFTLKQGTNSVAAVVSYDAATKTATLNPNANLQNNQTYTATITTGVKDTAGNALATAKTWTFTTAAACTPPSVTTQPTNQSITYGADATFDAAASGTSPSVKWQKSTDNGATWNDISAATSTTLTLTKPPVSDSGSKYRAVFTNSCGNATSNAATLTVAAKNLTVSGASANNKTYDGTANATVNFGSASLVGVETGDTVTINSSGYSASFGTKDVGTGKAVTVTGVVLSGTSAGNYTVSQPSGLTANITAKALTVSATGVDRVYDGTTNATVNLSTDKLNGDTVNAAYTSASFANKNVGTGKSVSVSGISISGANAGNYNLTNTTASTTANITARPITVTAVSDSKVYDGTTSSSKTPQITPTGGIANGDTANFSQAFNTKSAGSGKTLIPSGSVNDGNSGNNYNVTFANNTNGVITAKDVTGSFTADNKVYDGTTDATVTGRSLNGVLSPGGTLDDVNLDGGTASFANENVGTGKTVTLTGATLVGADRDNYNLSSVGTTTANITAKDLTVTAKDQNITFGDNLPANDVTYNGFVNNETKSVLGGTLQFSYNPADPHDVGTYDIVPSGLTSTNYDISFVEGTLTIAQANQSIDFSAPTGKTYGDADFDPGATASSGLAVSYSSSTTGVCTIVQGKVHIISAGTCTIEASQSGNSNYKAATSVSRSFEIAKKALTVTADSQSKTYGDNDPALTYKVTSGSLVGSNTFSGSLARDAGENVGSYAIKQNTLTAGGNYALTYIGANLTITKADLTVKANDDSREYGDANPAFTGTLAGVNNDDNITANYGTSATAASPVGTYGIVPTLSDPGNKLANYNVTKTNGTLTVGKAALTVTAKDATKVYGEANPAFGVTYSGFKLTDGPASLGGTLGFDTAATQSSPVGTYDVTPKGLTSGNYNISFLKGTLTVTKATLTVKAEDEQKVYGEANPALTASYSGFVNGDTASAVSGSPDLSTAATQNSDAGTYPIAASAGNLSATNYSFTFQDGTLTVTKRPITVTADAQSKTYGDPDPNLNYNVTIGNLVGTDGFTGALTRVVGENVGTYAINKGTLMASSNYNLTFVGANLTISKKQLLVNAKDQSTVYGDSHLPASYELTGFVNGENPTSAGITGAPVCTISNAAGTDVGMYNDVIVCTTGNLSASNYSFAAGTKGDLTITKRPITVTPDTGQSKVYGQNDPTLGYHLATGSSLANGDNFANVFIGSLSRSSGETVADGPYAITQGDLTANSNYNLKFDANGVTFAITPKPITVTPDTGQSKVYGQNDPTMTYTVPSGSLVGNDAITGKLSRDPGENVGTYAIILGSLTAGSNYGLSLSSPQVPFAITKKPISGTFSAENKVYDGTTAATVTGRSVNQADVVGTDNVGLTGGTASFDNKNVGTGKTVTLTGATLAGTDAANYNLTSVGTATADITVRPITVTADPQTKVYGQADPNLSYKVTSQLGLAQGDSFSGALTRDPGETVAGSPYAIKQGTLSADSNYNLSFVGANLTITAANTTTTVVQQSPTQYSDVVTLTANVTGPGTPTGTVQFKINGSNVGTPQDLSGGSASLPYTVTQAPNTYQVTAVFNSSSSNWSNSTSAGQTLTVKQEDAKAEFSGATYYSTPTAGGSVSVTLTAVITDAADGSHGDIRNATVSFINRDATGQPAFTNCANRPVGYVTVGDTTVGTATCNTTLTAGTSTTTANLYTVGMIVNNYYTRNDSLDDSIVTVAQSVAGSITGGGYLVNELSGGQYAGDTGQKTNFGFNVRLDKNGSPKGQINTIVRRGGRVYQIKGNAMTSLTTKVCQTGAASATCPGTSTFNGKASIQDITNPLAPISIDGNASLQVKMTDKGEPGSSDTIGITVWNKNGGLWFSSRWVSPNTVEQLLAGGNLVVR